MYATKLPYNVCIVILLLVVQSKMERGKMHFFLKIKQAKAPSLGFPHFRSFRQGFILLLFEKEVEIGGEREEGRKLHYYRIWPALHMLRKHYCYSTTKGLFRLQHYCFEEKYLNHFPISHLFS